MVIVEAVLAFIVLVGILVFVHEMGHFLAARWCGMRADVFAIGMGPRLFGWNKLTGFTFGKLPEGLELDGNTDYRVSAFPIGGYVKILGMVDESMDTEFANRAPEPWEFRSKGTAAKILVISAGVIMNFLLAIVVFSGLNFVQGKVLNATTTVGPVSAESAAYAAGLKEGDKIVQVNGRPVKYFDEIPQIIYEKDAEKDVALGVERGGMPLTITIPRARVSPDSAFPFMVAGTVVSISEVMEESPAERAGILPGDVIRSVDGTPISTSEQFINYLGDHPGRPLVLQVERAGTVIKKDVTPNEDNKIGVGLESEYRGPKERIDYGFFGSISEGTKQTLAVTAGTFGLVGKLVSGKAKLKESVGGPGMIANVAQKAASRGIDDFLKLMAILSVTLACMNILPIPALDGGHLVFIIVEGIMRREVPLKVRMAIQQVGFALLIIFMMFVLYNDTARLIGN